MRSKPIVLSLVFLCAALGAFVSPAGASPNGGGAPAGEMGHRMTLLVLQLAVIIITARLLGLLAGRYLRQPRVLGELAAGMIIGPYALGRLHLPFLGGSLFPLPAGTIPVSPELYGVAVIASVILLFLAGLETDLKTFLRYSLMGSVVGITGVVLSFLLGDFAAVLFLPSVSSFFAPTALFLGTLSTATSVGITARILSEKRKMSSPEGVVILAGAVLDDVLGIVLLAVVVGIASLGGQAVAWGRIALIAVKALGFWLVCTVLGIIAAPRLTRGLKWFRSLDVIASTAFGLALLMAGLAEMFGLAMIIGAYIMGLSLSQTDMAQEIRSRLHGLYQFLVPVFFCVMGMMVNFAAMKGVIIFGLIYTGAAIAGKLLGCGLPALFMGFNIRGALRVGAGMLPRGEVTLIVAGIGLSSGAIGADIFGVAIVTLLIASIIAPPLLVRSFEGGSGLRAKMAAGESEEGRQIQLSFPSAQMAEFLSARIRQAFRDEEFFVHRLDMDQPIYQIRKEEIAITLTREQNLVRMNTASEYEQIMRLVVLEEILEMKSLLEDAQKMESPERLGRDLASGLFD
jgi:Kef-type K+ transport system membrane component KefB